MIKTNRIIWIIIFLSGVAYMAMLEWESDQQVAVGWFLFTGLWSAFCGIGFTIFDWLMGFRNIDS